MNYLAGDSMNIPKKNCPVCDQEDSQLPLIEIEALPVFCNVLLPDRQRAVNVPLGDIHLFYCECCGHVYNGAFDPSKIDYSPSYENSLHFSANFQTYAELLATRLVATYDLKGRTVLEVGCGKGDFLRLMCKLGVGHSIGFDPSYEETLAAALDCRNFTVVRDYYSEKYTDLDVDMVICRHVLEHIEYPKNFLNTIRRTVGDRPGTVVFFEVPNVMYTLKDFGIWDLIYEHCGYFTSPSLIHLFKAAGFIPVSVRSDYGGQYLCIEAYPDIKTNPALAAQLEDPLRIAKYAKHFAAEYREKVTEWQRKVAGMKRSGKKTVVWGGGSKGVTFLNVMRGHAEIDYIVDVNPRKQGFYIPHTGQRVISPDALIDYKPDVVIAVNPQYMDEIHKALADRNIRSDLISV
jgi:SAM-dependent methyltransferase